MPNAQTTSAALGALVARAAALNDATANLSAAVAAALRQHGERVADAQKALDGAVADLRAVLAAPAPKLASDVCAQRGRHERNHAGRCAVCEHVLAPEPKAAALPGTLDAPGARALFESVARGAAAIELDPPEAPAPKAAPLPLAIGGTLAVPAPAALKAAPAVVAVDAPRVVCVKHGRPLGTCAECDAAPRFDALIDASPRADDAAKAAAFVAATTAAHAAVALGLKGNVVTFRRPKFSARGRDFRNEMDRRRAANLAIPASDETYAARGAIGELGGIWDSWGRRWTFPDRQALDAAQAIVDGSATLAADAPVVPSPNAPLPSPRGAPASRRTGEKSAPAAPHANASAGRFAWRSDPKADIDPARASAFGAPGAHGRDDLPA